MLCISNVWHNAHTKIAIAAVAAAARQEPVAAAAVAPVAIAPVAAAARAAAAAAAAVCAYHDMVIDGLCNGPSLWLQLAIEELIEGVEGLEWVCNVVGVKLPPKCPQEFVDLLQHMHVEC